MKKIILLIFFIALITVAFALGIYADGALVYAELAPGGEVTNVEEFIAAFGTSSYGEPNAELLVGSTNEVRLKNSLFIQAPIVIKNGDYTLVGGGCTIARSDGCGNAFIIEGGTLRFEREAHDSVTFPEDSEANMVIDGQGKTAEPFIKVGEGASMVINSRVLVKDLVTSESGAFIFAEESENVSVYACRFENCKATEYGGVICFKKADLESDKGSLIVKSSDFNNCEAGSGGAISSDVYTVIANSNFLQNTAVSGGGALCLFGTSELNAVDIKECNAFDGGAIYNKGTAMIVELDAFNNNAVCGGAIYNESSCLVKDIYFYENKATSRGGAVYNHGAFYYNGGSMMGNECADFGGGIYSSGGSLVKIESGEITSCVSEYAGGIYCDGTLIMAGGAVGKNDSKAPHIAVSGALEMSGSAVCYGGDVIGLVVNDGIYPCIEIKSALTNTDSQRVAIYEKVYDGLERANSSGIVIFKGEDAAVKSAIDVFSVEDGAFIPYKIAENGQMKLAFPTVLVLLIAAIVVVGAAGVVVFLKIKKRRSLSLKRK